MEITSIEYDKKGSIKKVTGKGEPDAVVTGNKIVDNMQIEFEITPMDEIEERGFDKFLLDQEII